MLVMWSGTSNKLNSSAATSDEAVDVQQYNVLLCFFSDRFRNSKLENSMV
jgi:hypothetical protein